MVEEATSRDLNPPRNLHRFTKSGFLSPFMSLTKRSLPLNNTFFLFKARLREADHAIVEYPVQFLLNHLLRVWKVTADERYPFNPVYTRIPICFCASNCDTTIIRKSGTSISLIS